MIPETHYARANSIHIAYQVFGGGPVDLVLVPGWVSHIDVFWDEPIAARFLLGLAEFSRVILFDKRGTGLSDRVTDTPSLEERMDDVRSVMDEVGSRKAALAGYSEGGPMCILFAATYPERTEALITIGSFPRRQYAADYPFGIPEDKAGEFFEMVETQWGGPLDIDRRAPTLSTDQRFCNWWGRFLRASASPAAANALQRANAQIDVRAVLSSVRVPTLILHAIRDRIIPVDASRFMARQIQDAKLVEIDADDHLPFGDGAESIVSEIERFLIGKQKISKIDRVISTVMFTDIIDSTRLAEKLGDKHWRDLLDAHHKAVRQELAIYRGKEVKTTGDGFHATFDGPARAIQCAEAIHDSTHQLGLDLRIGIHTGECEIREDSLEGVAIHIAARVAGIATSGDTVVSRTVKDLVAGSGIEFKDFGTYELKGIPDEYQVFKVAAT
jgi:pimeloyl-ACP methyl ester carboxylesterase